MKEETTLMTANIPKSILKDFDEAVAKDNLVLNRTAKLVIMMAAEIRKDKRKNK